MLPPTQICYRLVLIEKEYEETQYFIWYFKKYKDNLIERLEYNICGITFVFYVQQEEYQGTINYNNNEEIEPQTCLAKWDDDIASWVEIRLENFCSSFYTHDIPKLQQYGVSGNLEILKEIHLKIVIDLITNYLKGKSE